MSTRFEDRLLTELQSVVHANPAPVARRHVGRRVAAAAATVAAGVAGFTLIGGGASPAFAVDQRSDGSVTVTIRSLSDADGLERALAKVGITADVTYTPKGEACAEGRYAASPAEQGTSSVDESPTSLRFTIGKDQVQPGQTLVVETNGGGSGPSSIKLGVANGAVGPCRLVPSTGAPAGAVTHTYGG